MRRSWPREEPTPGAVVTHPLNTGWVRSAVLDRHLPQIRQAIDKCAAPLRVRGEVIVAVTIDSRGHANKSKVLLSNIAAPSVTECVRKTLLRVRVPMGSKEQNRWDNEGAVGGALTQTYQIEVGPRGSR